MCGLAAMASSVALRRAPVRLSALTSTLMLSASIAVTTRVMPSGDARLPGWPWMSMTGNFAFGTGCCSVTSVDVGR